MKKVILILFVFISFCAKAQQTNKSTYVITGSKFGGKDVSTEFVNGKSRLILYNQNGNQYLDIIRDCESKSWSHGVITDNDIPSKTVPKTSTTYESILLHKNWKYTTFFNSDNTTTSFILDEVSLILVNKPDRVIMNCSILSSDGLIIEYSGYMIN